MVRIVQFLAVCFSCLAVPAAKTKQEGRKEVVENRNKHTGLGKWALPFLQLWSGVGVGGPGIIWTICPLKKAELSFSYKGRAPHALSWPGESLPPRLG